MIQHLFGRVGRLIRSNFHALIEKNEYSEAKETLSHAMAEFDAAVDDVKAALGRLAAVRHTTRHDQQTARKNHQDLAAQLTAALTANRDAEAQTIIKKQIKLESELSDFDARLAQFSEESRAMEDCLSALKAKREILAKALDQTTQPAEKMGTDGLRVGDSSGIDPELNEKITRADLAFDRIMASRPENTIQETRRAGASEKLEQIEEMAVKTEIEKRLAEARQRMKKND